MSIRVTNNEVRTLGKVVLLTQKFTGFFGMSSSAAIKKTGENLVERGFLVPCKNEMYQCEYKVEIVINIH